MEPKGYELLKTETKITVLEKELSALFVDFKKYEPKNTRWGNLAQDQGEEQSPKNTFQKRRSDFSRNSRDNNSRDNNSRGNNSHGNNLYGRHTDRYGNYKGSPFRRETRPKTPPPKKFKMEETDFPPLG